MKPSKAQCGCGRSRAASDPFVTVVYGGRVYLRQKRHPPQTTAELEQEPAVVVELRACAQCWSIYATEKPK